MLVAIRRCSGAYGRTCSATPSSPTGSEGPSAAIEVGSLAEGSETAFFVKDASASDSTCNMSVSCSECSNACTVRHSFPEPALVWRLSNGSSLGMVAASGPRERPAKGRRFISCCPMQARINVISITERVRRRRDDRRYLDEPARQRHQVHRVRETMPRSTWEHCPTRPRRSTTFATTASASTCNSPASCSASSIGCMATTSPATARALPSCSASYPAWRPGLGGRQAGRGRHLLLHFTRIGAGHG